MAGGIGSRLFPISTPDRPKQFIDLTGSGRTLIQLTFDRYKAVSPDARFWVITGERYRHFIREQLPEIPESHILCEPEGRNTAPAIALAAWMIEKEDPQATMIVTPSDAYVPDAAAFSATMRTAADFVASTPTEAIVCIGIKPTYACTGYGYIKAPFVTDAVVKIDGFKEKPSEDVARQYFESGDYCWNAGIFVWKLSTIIGAIRRYVPQIAGIMDEISSGAPLQRFVDCEKISIDYAVMEKHTEIYSVRADWKWSDLGSFEAIIEITGRDPREN